MKQIVALLIVLFLIPLSASAQDFCEGNFDYDDDQDGTDAVQFKTDFGRHQYNNSCPPDGPAPVQQTGQNTCYDESGAVIDCAGSGQDGDHQKGVNWPNPRFADNLDGTITDNLTGLIWLKDANCFGERSWQNALSDCNGLVSGSCGLTDGSYAGDWRLPNYKELLSLIDDENRDPALPSGHPFSNVPISNTHNWSSTTYVVNVNYARCIQINSGWMTICDKDGDTYYVWPVRGGH